MISHSSPLAIFGVSLGFQALICILAQSLHWSMQYHVILGRAITTSWLYPVALRALKGHSFHTGWCGNVSVSFKRLKAQVIITSSSRNYVYNTICNLFQVVIACLTMNAITSYVVITRAYNHIITSVRSHCEYSTVWNYIFGSKVYVWYCARNYLFELNCACPKACNSDFMLYAVIYVIKT